MAQETNTNSASWQEKPPVRFLVFTLGGIAVLVAGVMALMWCIADWGKISQSFSRYKGGQSVMEHQAPVLRKKPRLQIDEKADIEAYRKGENERLHSYKQLEGRVQIPIEEAMKLTVERGLPARKGN